MILIFNWIIVGDTPLVPTNRSSREKMNKKIVALNDTLDEMDFTDVYRIVYPKSAENIFFSRVHEHSPR